MRALIILLLFAAACTVQPAIEPVPEFLVEPTQPAILTPPDEEPLVELPKEVDPPKLVTHEIRFANNKFDAQSMTIMTGEKIMFVSDDKLHIVSCYAGPDRIEQGPRIQNGKIYTITFNQQGAYTCIDAIYGGRLPVTVKESTNAITGNVVAVTSSTGSFIVGLLIALGLVIFIVWLWRK